MDDILIYSNTLQQHRLDVRNIIKAIQTSGMKVKSPKCEFHKEETEYLGFIINREGIKTDPVKTQAIWDWKTPKNKTDIPSFLGFCNFYRWFIEGFSRTAKPLYDRTPKKYDSKWELTDKEHYAFDELRRKLTMVAVMVHFNPSARTKIETDASKSVCSGILSQQGEDGKWRPAAYRSKTMQDAKCNYDIHDKELLAIIQAFKEWKRYMRGSHRPVQVFTNYKNLVTFMMTNDLSERQGRWQEFLSQYNFRIIYRSGKEGRKPDTLTRRPGDIPTTEEKKGGRRREILLPKEVYWDIPKDEDIKFEEMELAEFRDKDQGSIRKVYEKDEEAQAIKKNLDNDVKEMKGVALGLCEWKDEHQWYKGRIWIPNDEELRTSIIWKNEDGPLAGQWETEKTTELDGRQYYWPSMRETIKRYVRNCNICQRSKVIRHAPYGMLQPNEVPDQPWKSIAMDFITDLPILNG